MRASLLNASKKEPPFGSRSTCLPDFPPACGWLFRAAARPPLKGWRCLAASAFRLFPAALLAVLVFTAHAEQPPQLEVTGLHITAGDLARILPGWRVVPASTTLSHAPLPGVLRRLHPADLAWWAQRYGVDSNPSAAPRGIIISRRTRKFDSVEAVTALRKQLAERHGIRGEQIEIELPNYTPPFLPDGELTFRLLSPVRRQGKPATYTLRWKDARGQQGQVPLRAVITLHGLRAVAKHNLQAGSEIAVEDFVFEDGPLPGPPAASPVNKDDISGRRLQRTLHAGDVLHASYLGTPKAVRRGDLIELGWQSGSVQLRVPAKAEQDGARGERIVCRNLESGRRVTAIVRGARYAEVGQR